MRVATLRRLVPILIVVGALVAAPLSFAGCANTTKKLVVVETQIHDGLGRLNQLERDFCAKNEKFKQQCDDLNPLMITLLKSGDSFNRAVADQQVTDLLALTKAGGDVAKALLALPTSATGQMIIELTKALGAAGSMLGGGK